MNHFNDSKWLTSLYTTAASWLVGSSGTTGDLLSLQCDPALLQAAQSAAARLVENNALPFWPGRDSPPVVRTGVVASSDRWTQHRPSIEALHRTHQTLCEEMECQAIATVCRAYGIPFLGELNALHFSSKWRPFFAARKSCIVPDCISVAPQPSKTSATTSCAKTLLTRSQK